MGNLNIEQAISIRKGLLREMYRDSMANIALDLGISKQTVWKCGKKPVTLDMDMFCEILRRKLNYRVLKERMEPYRLRSLQDKYGVSSVFICRVQSATSDR